MSDQSDLEVNSPPTSLPAWAPIPAYVLGGIVGASALAASGVELYSLARNASAPMLVCIALFVGLDSGGAAGGIAWVSSRGAPGSPLHSFGKRVTLGLAGASSLLNGVSVLADPHRNHPLGAILPWQFVTGVAVLIAVGFPWVAMFMVHLILLVLDDAPKKPAKPQPAPVEEKVDAPAEELDEFEEIVDGLDLETSDDTGPVPGLEVERLAVELMEQYNRNELRELCRAERVDGNVIAGNKRDAAMALAAKRLRERTS